MRFTLHAIIALVALALCGLPPAAHATESDDIWAEAIFSSIPSTNITRQQVETLFLRALQKAEAKGPILVSLGDYYSGPGQMALAVNSLTTRIQEDTAPVFEKQAEAMAASGHEPSDTEIKKLAEAISELTNKSLLKHAGGIVALFAAAESQSLRYYLAAVEEDPKLPVAWLRIATSQNAGKKLQLTARSTFAKCDPKNSMPYYLQAFVFNDHERMSQALNAVQKGNLRSFRTPRTPMPEHFTLAFPDTEPHRDAGVAGTPMTHATLNTYAMANDSFSSMGLYVQFRNLTRGLIKHAGVLKTSGKQDQAIRCLESVATLGLALVRNENRDTTPPLIGLAIAKTAAEELLPLYEAAQLQDKVENLKTFAEARKRYMAEYSKFLESTSEMLDSADEMDLETLRKIEKRQEDEIQFITTLLKNTGLSSISF
jgi:hypothetical protein